jgi:hypothetical protein
MPTPSKLTPELQSQICGYVNGGVPIPTACGACGISWNTVQTWLRKGRDGEKPYAEFVAALNQAKNRWEAAAAIRVTKAADKDWKAAAWMLERRRHEIWGAREKLELTGKGGGAIKVETDAAALARVRAAVKAASNDDGEA